MSMIFTQYKITTDWTSTKYCGFTMTWDHHNGTVKISFPGYFERALHKFHHLIFTRKQHAPHAYYTPKYGTNNHITARTSTLGPIDTTGTMCFQ